MSNDFRPSITVSKGITLYAGAVLGSGILILPGITGSVAGTDALIAWVIMILLSIPLACTFAFLSIEYQSAGGIAFFVEKAFGSYIGAMMGWFFFIAGSVGQVIVSLTGGVYIAHAFHLPGFVSYMTAAAILAIALVGNYIGIKTSGAVQFFVGCLTVVILMTAIFSALPLIDFKTIHFDFSHRAVWSIAKASLLIFWSFFGWEAISSLAPEFREPRKRNILASTWGAVLIVGTLYFGIALAVIGTNAYEKGTAGQSSINNSAALVQVIKQSMGSNMAWITAVAAFTICAGTTNAFVAAMSRLGYAISRQNAAPAWRLGYVNQKRQTPTHSVILVSLIAVTGIATSGLFHIGLEKLVLIPNSLGIASYIAGTAAGIKLLRTVTGKILSAVACLFCLAAYPFIGSAIIVPIIVAAIYTAYLVIRKTKRARLKKHGDGKPI